MVTRKSSSSSWKPERVRIRWCKEQNMWSSQEVKRPLQQEAKGEKCRLQGGDLIRQEEGLESNGWRLDWESESVHEESLGPPSFPSCRSSPSPRWEPLCSAAWISPPPLSLLQDLLGLLLLLPLAPDVQERQKGAAVTRQGALPVMFSLLPGPRSHPITTSPPNMPPIFSQIPKDATQASICPAQRWPPRYIPVAVLWKD
uniref:uncharacterized protein LOC114606916 isoform X4 n=1 Tax=Podarcis muralis TaxID=64176 RepID=UPI00109F677B|nr:uncharacterized protein LOC114606916 isoform X4 [Podarcis muralis]